MSAARERALALMVPAERERALESESGDYVDALQQDLRSTGVAQNLMVTRLVPRIYERWWRPALGQIAKGITGPGMAEEVRIARLLLGMGAGDCVLDLACGPGNFSREFGRTVGPEGLVVGVDVSTTMLDRGALDLRRSGLENLAFVRADATALPFAGASFDATCCFAALHLMPDPMVVLDELNRVLKPGGRIAVMTSVRRQLTVRPLKPLIERTSGMRLFEPDEVVGALQDRGFTDLHQRLAGMVQFVGGRRADAASGQPAAEASA